MITLPNNSPGKVLAALLLVGSVTLSLHAAVKGSAHDFSTKGWGSTETCVYCHAPHNARTPQLVPLWNHTSSTATYGVYTSATISAAPGQPGGTSKACLSCHDGTVAVDSYATRTGTTFIGGGANLGTDLSNDHPVSFTYDAALATSDGGLVTPSSSSYVDAGKKVPLYAAKVECASCHDVHNSANQASLLRVSNAGSALCLSCHNK